MFAEIDNYEIKESKKKLYLVSVEPGRKSLVAKESVTVSVSVKYGVLKIGKKAWTAMNMNNAFYKLSYDSGNNVIAWRIRHDLDNHQLEERGWRVAKASGKNQTMTISVGRILQTFTLKPGKDTYGGLIVKKYQDKTSSIDADSYYYIEVSEVQEQE